MLTSVDMPSTAGAAAQLLAASSSAVPMAGGTIVMPIINAGAHGHDRLVSLKRAVPSAIEVADGQARIGAGATLAALGEAAGLAFLRPAIASIAAPNIRNLATIGGNLFAEQPYGDLAVCLVALGAVATVATGEATALLDVERLVAGAMPKGGIVTQVSFQLPAEGSWFYRKAARRALNSASIVTVAAQVTTAGGVVERARIALGGCVPYPKRAAGAEAELIGKPLGFEAVRAAAEAARADAAPRDDAYASAWYRDRVLPVHLRRALIGA